MAVTLRLPLCLLLCLWAWMAQAQPEFPPLSGRVVDQAELLDAPTEARLSQLLAAHEQASSEQLVVVTLENLQGVAIEDFGYQLGRHWGIGQKGKDNGALLLIARDERKLRIEVGYGLEGRLTDAQSSVIINQIITPASRPAITPKASTTAWSPSSRCSAASRWPPAHRLRTNRPRRSPSSSCC